MMPEAGRACYAQNEAYFFFFSGEKAPILALSTMNLRWMAAQIIALALGFGCGTRSVPNPFAFDAGPDGGGGGGGGGEDPMDAGPGEDPTLGGPCVDDGQCDDGLACTPSDKCDLGLQRCRFTPDHTLCQNSFYCDGEERCDNKLGCSPGVPVGCSDGTPCTLDACDEATQTCTHAPRDADGDGDPDIHCTGGGDCDDADPTISATAPEICGDGRDNNCDSKVDEAPCVTPAHDTCADPLEINASGTYKMATTGAAFDYATQCGLSNQPGTADVVAALLLPKGPLVDVEIAARTQGAPVSVAIATQCGDPTKELACSGPLPAPQGGQIAKLYAHALGSPAQRTALPIYIATQPAAELTLEVQIHAPSPIPTNETCGSAQPITAGVPVTVPIFGAVKDVESVCATPLGDLVYSFTLPAPADVDVYGSSIDGDGLPSLSLRGPGCALLGDEIACHKAPSAHIFRHALPGGTYFVAVSASAPTTSLVTVEIKPPSPLEPNESCSGAPPIPPNKTLPVALALHQDDINLGCFPGSVDAAYALDLPFSSDVLLVERIGQGDTGGVELSLPACGAAQDLLVCGTGASSPVRASKRNVPAGAYRVIAETLKGGDTELTALVRPAAPTTLVPFADACADAFTLPPEGGFFQGNTVNATANFSAGCDQGTVMGAGAPDQLLKLVLSAQKRVILEMNGSSYTTLLDVRKGPACPGTEVPLGCAVGFAASRSYLDLTLPADTYYLQVDGFSFDAGAWSLDVRVVDP